MPYKRYEKPYEPYKMDSFKELMKWAYMLGWYTHKPDLITIKMVGAFEGFSGHASETWEHWFYVKIPAIPELGIVEFSTDGETLEDACKAMLKHLEDTKEK